MARNASVRVKIEADNRDLHRKTAGAARDLDKFEKSGTRSMDRLKTAAAGATGLLGVGLVKGLFDSVKAASAAEASNARLKAQLEASGYSFRAHGDDIDRVIKKHADLAAVDDEDLQDAFTNIVRGSGSLKTAMDNVGLAADISRAKNIDLAKAGDLIGKVASGNTGILGRYGIKIRDGASATEALGKLQERFAGQGKKYGETTAGGVERAQNAFENLKEQIGTSLAPIIREAANKTAKFIDQIRQGTGAGGRFRDRLQEIRDKVAPIVKFFRDHPKLIGIAVGAWATYKTASFIALNAIKVSNFRKVFMKSVPVAGTAGTAAGGAYATGFTAASSTAITKAAKGGRLRNAFVNMGRALGIAAAAAGAVSIAAELRRQAPPIVDSITDEIKRTFTPGTKGDPYDPTDPVQIRESREKGLDPKTGKPRKNKSVGGHSLIGGASDAARSWKAIPRGSGGGAGRKGSSGKGGKSGGGSSNRTQGSGGSSGGSSGGGGGASGTLLQICSGTICPRFGLRISSTYRTPEHNRAVGGVENSWHTRGSSSNPGAVDMVGSTSSMYAALAWAKANISGLAEAMVHDVGSGLHLHLAGIVSGASSGGSSGGSSGSSGSGTPGTTGSYSVPAAPKPKPKPKVAGPFKPKSRPTVTALDMLEKEQSEAGLTATTTDDLAVARLLKKYWKRRLKRARKRGDVKGITEASQALASINGTIADLTATPEAVDVPEDTTDTSADDAATALAAAIQSNTEMMSQAVDAQRAATALSERIFGTQTGVVLAGIADILSGQIGGGVGLGVQTPSFAGGKVRFG